MITKDSPDHRLVLQMYCSFAYSRVMGKFMVITHIVNVLDKKKNQEQSVSAALVSDAGGADRQHDICLGVSTWSPEANLTQSP